MTNQNIEDLQLDESRMWETSAIEQMLSAICLDLFTAGCIHHLGAVIVDF